MLFLTNEVFNQALEITWKGLLSLFLAMGIIFIITVILNKVTKNKNNEK